MMAVDLSASKAACLSCRKCPLCETRTQVVYGVGPTETPVMFVGEGPGRQEDQTGVPFVGAAGQLLDRMLSIIDLGRDNCYIANIVKCRPPENRDPLLVEQDACFPWLEEQIRAISPKIIVCLGRISATRLIREDFRITKEHGSWTEKDGIFYTAVYHPSALLRDVAKRPESFYDLLEIRKKVQELCPELYEKKTAVQ